MAGNVVQIVMKQTKALAFIPGDYKGWTNRFKVAGSTGNEYTVSMRISDKVWGCSCRGWIGHRTCHHLNPILPILIAAVPGSKATEPIRRIKGTH